MRVAVCQMSSKSDVSANLVTASRLAREAAQLGATLVALPEFFAFQGREEEWKRVAREHTPRVLEQMSRVAAQCGVWLCLGSVFEDIPNSDKCATSAVMIGPDGMEIARYRKRHLFDAHLPNQQHRESQYLVPGDSPVVCEVDDWCVGLSICFDVRFPTHFQELRRMGAELILLPSAFTAFTGQAHWEPLLRARAIETQCYLAAPAQWGECVPGKVFFGHSMVVSPWGKVIICARPGEGTTVAELDKAELLRVRQMIPLDKDLGDANSRH